MNKWLPVAILVGIASQFYPSSSFAQGTASFDSLQAHFESTQRPYLKRYCLDCHSASEKQGELDLEPFASVSDIRQDVVVWQRVLEMLEDREMPPKDADRQPSSAEHAAFTEWVQALLNADAIANAGDPGPVVLRRLNNAEFTYTIQDLSGISLQPASQFPSDSAAGEGFTNVGSALSMSPALLQKYLDAAKEISNHAMLLPTGIRFSERTTKQDWTNERVAEIQKFYARFADSGGATSVNLQGIQFETNGGGRLPLQSYLLATISERDALKRGETTLAIVAQKHSLNEKYLSALWLALNDDAHSILFDLVRSKWRAATPEKLDDLIATIVQWQKALWRFTTIGHIGKRDGPTAWQVPIEPFSSLHEIRTKLPRPKDGRDLSLVLVASDLADGNENDVVVWDNPRFSAPGKPDLRLRDLRETAAFLSANRGKVLASASACLNAAMEVISSKDNRTMDLIAKEKAIDELALKSWFHYLGVAQKNAPIDSYIATKLESTGGYEFVKGWTGEEALSVIANSSDQMVRVPGDMRPHGIGVHPTPKRKVAVGWKSPIDGRVKVSGFVQRAHIGCGNGVTWALEHRRRGTHRLLASGSATNADVHKLGIEQEIEMSADDLIALIIGPRNAEHSCDLTAIDLVIQGTRESSLDWSLSKDVSPDILAGNPHSDRHGNGSVWHFFSEPDTATEKTRVPAGSLLDKWWNTTDRDEKQRLAGELGILFDRGIEGLAADSPDALLFKQLSSLSGPLFATVRSERSSNASGPARPADDLYGLDPAQFGIHPNGSKVDDSSLVVIAPSIVEVRVPTDLVEGYEFVVSGSLHPETGSEGTVQLQVLFERPAHATSLATGDVVVKGAKSTWSDGDQPVQQGTPILVMDKSNAKRRLSAQVDAFRQLFPAALCYTKIVPVDEVVTLTLFHREDDHLKRLMLSQEQAMELDRLWDELQFVSQAPLSLVDAYEQLWQFATQDADPSAFTPMRDGIMLRAEHFKEQVRKAEPMQLKAVLQFAEQAWRKPLSELDTQKLIELYHRLRAEELDHSTAIRMLLSRVLVAPSFLYRGEVQASGTRAPPVSDHELATRLSYFLWSTMPDRELRNSATDRSLQSNDVLLGHVRRMLSDPRMRRMAIEFGCQWLHVRDFDQLDEKSEKLFPEFAELKTDMREETIRFLEDLFRNDGSILDLLNADYTFVNSRLAKFYGIPNVDGDWQRVNDTGRFARGGILRMASTMAKQSGASRTSPILRGNWVSEFVLGEKLPRPPKNVPVLPEDVPADLTERQLVERHSSDAACAKCHSRIDGFGYALEHYDTIGRLRSEDMHGRKIDASSWLRDGTRVDGVEGLTQYLTTTRRDDFLNTFCRRLLGYALGRSVQLSDKPLIDEMITELKANGYRISIAVERIVLSPQFRTIRGANPTATK